VNFPYRLAAIDLDGTLLAPDHQISERNAAAVERLVSLGVLCVLATGRAYDSTLRYARRLALQSVVICFNGAMVREVASGETWLHQRVPAGLAEEIVAFGQENGFHLNYYLNDALYMAERTPRAEQYLAKVDTTAEFVGDLRVLNGNEPTKIILIDSPNVVASLEPRFQSRYASDSPRPLYVTRSEPEYLEFMPPTASKGNALAFVAERMGIAQGETLAFGDNYNDLPMLRWAGMSVAMAHAEAEVRKGAQRVAPPSREEGFALAVEELLQRVQRPLR
jgi:Cof subfamily protein (haloacid dehalogenase superfamily)